MREIGEMTKEQERERLNREIWAVAEALRASSTYKPPDLSVGY